MAHPRGGVDNVGRALGGVARAPGASARSAIDLQRWQGAFLAEATATHEGLICRQALPSPLSVKDKHSPARNGA
jgi:hypothetical protein